VRFLFAMFLFYLILSACDRHHSQKNVENPDLLLLSSNFQTSILYALKEGVITEIASGLSADPILLGPKDQIFLFNRKDTDLNFNRVNLTGNQAIHLKYQLSSAPLTPGDPTSSAELPDKNLVLAGYSSGKIFKLDPVSSKIEEVQLKFDTGTEPFRPYDIFIHTKDNQTKIFILHHGLDRTFSPNQTEMLFAATWSESGFAPIDLNSELEGIQGIKVKSTSPQFLFKNHESPIVVGLCDSTGINKNCSIEKLDTDSVNLTEIANLSKYTATASNAVTEGFDSQSIFFMKETSSNEIVITKFTFAGNDSTIFTLKDEGFQAFIKSDLSRGKLYAGGKRSLLEFQNEALVNRHPLQFSPYTGYTVE
jgi:hypothetical protein